MREISAQALRACLVDRGELAVLDAREEGEFGLSHLFWATPCPLSQVETRAPRLLPCRSVRVVCVDDSHGLAERLAQWLLDAGYGDISVLAGGIGAWAAVGYELFGGVHVPSKAFGEWVEHVYGTESVDAPVLKEWLDSGRNMVVLDSRTFEEFHHMSIPGAMNVPGGELAYRIGDLAPDPETLVVVNCAGRTRSIMGRRACGAWAFPTRSWPCATARWVGSLPA